ncbi:hypothetical protein A6M27_12865 [Acidithiobacillus thiooxidans]|uniref:Polymerase beta nucleotidyltransferase domain-containing protein n=1 Tax=Acidithiobacillus thiooxidans TaxID=930 RepID=A0A1C2JDP8_ACITH|nr:MULTISPECIES: nucleotidyltransferase domain-containing protein [Acidithiobacillus]MDA8175711.1 nucleotidyltransferase domain-containing protein [Acidithiobacillus sp.]OCX68201.1 hypothetical protein A6O24_19905 [Acidithiobacillus thiooxidans]OCX72908.1 hypothetical protein A6M23_08985 [Acidithiobacillus thiooxidans]OCX82580.1 hypothetical protein A6O26_09565 [Acidithiobacillus thiooxidans]OCX86363.1 hypothetical protein A6M27_12865 [Acidithiobacillus thiooxidans]
MHIHGQTLGKALRSQAKAQAQSMRNQIREQLVPAVAQYLPIESVWVFGSVARNEPSTNSDADVLLMLAAEIDEKTVFRSIRKALRDADLSFSCDVIAWTPKGYADRSSSQIAFFTEIMKERILLWESTNNRQNQYAG